MSQSIHCLKTFMKMNYRPISLLPSFSKIFGKAMLGRLEGYFESRNIFSHLQHGFRRGRSVETATYDFISRILQNFEDKMKTLGAFLDLFKAFDSLDHQLLLRKLELYGIQGPALKWIESYLSDRSQKVCLEVEGCKTLSDAINIELGIPQGSVIGPFLFLVYINDLSQAVSDNASSLVNFADDSNSLIWAKTSEGLFLKANQTLERAERWFAGNKLLLNCDKSVFLCFRTSQSRDQYPDSLQLLSQNVELSESVCFLGIHIDNNLSWETQIEHVCKKLNSACFSLRVLKDYLQQKTLLTTYYVNVYSILWYGVVFWGGAVRWSEVFVIQKRALRILHGIRARDSCRGKFKALNILTFPGIYIFECIMFLFKHFLRFSHLLPLHEHNTRTTNLNIPVHRLSLSERGPMYACVSFYNKLPREIQQVKSPKVFKKKMLQFILEIEPYSISEYLDFLPL